MAAEISYNLVDYPWPQYEAFHLSTVIRHRRNSLDALKTTVGAWIRGKEAIGSYIVNHFQRVFIFDNPEV